MTMDHAEAHERIADLALERDALERLDPADPEDRAFTDHVRGCASCTTDLAAARAMRDGLRMALTDQDDGSAVQPIGTPEWLRGAVLEAARREPRAPRATRAVAGRWHLALPRLSAPRWTAAIAAVLAIALIGGLAGRELQRLSGGGGPMAGVVATLDRVLVATDHHIAQLRTTDGTAAGSVAWSSSDFAVLTSSLPAPSGDRVYRCWLQWSGRWAAVGAMEFSGATAYWTGPVGDWGPIVAQPGTTFVVTLEPATPPGDQPSGSVVLQAGLAS